MGAPARRPTHASKQSEEAQRGSARRERGEGSKSRNSGETGGAACVSPAGVLREAQRFAPCARGSQEPPRPRTAEPEVGAAEAHVVFEQDNMMARRADLWFRHPGPPGRARARVLREAHPLARHLARREQEREAERIPSISTSRPMPGALFISRARLPFQSASCRFFSPPHTTL